MKSAGRGGDVAFVSEGREAKDHPSVLFNFMD